MSNSPGSFKEVDLPLSQLNDNLTRCPRCSGAAVTLEGDFLRHFVEEFRNGESVEIDLSDRCKLVHRIHCDACQITFSLVADDIFNEKRDHMRARIELARRDGLLASVNTNTSVIN